MKTELTWKFLKKYIQYSNVFYHYDEDLKRANFYSDDEETMLEINDWILDYFPHYLDNIDYGKCDDSDNHRNNPSDKKLYFSLICIESGYKEVA